MAWKIVWSSKAESDLLGIREYILKGVFSAQMANITVKDLYRAVTAGLKANPYKGKDISKLYEDMLLGDESLHKLVVPPYICRYVADPVKQEITVLRVWNEEQYRSDD